MDDMVFFSDSREYLKKMLRLIEEFIENNLNLKLNSRATVLNSGLHGLPFLGYRVFPNLIRVKKENLVRIKRRICKRLSDYNNGRISEDKLVMSVRSWFEYLGFANSLNIRSSYIIPWAGVV